MAVPASSLRDGDKWEQVASKVATATATGAAVGLGLAVLLFGGVRSRSACLSVCTGAGLGHGLTLAKGTFEDARAHLPAQLSQGPHRQTPLTHAHAIFRGLPQGGGLLRGASTPWRRWRRSEQRAVSPAHLPCPCTAATTEEVWDRGVVNGIKKSGVGLVAGGLLALLVPAPIRMACMTGGTGVGLGYARPQTLTRRCRLAPPSAPTAESIGLTAVCLSEWAALRRCWRWSSSRLVPPPQKSEKGCRS